MDRKDDERKSYNELPSLTVEEEDAELLRDIQHIVGATLLVVFATCLLIYLVLGHIGIVEIAIVSATTYVFGPRVYFERYLAISSEESEDE